jgi:hypothetical protein
MNYEKIGLRPKSKGSIINQQIIAGLKLNIEKARELRHRLITIRRLTLEQIHSCRQRNVTSVGVRRMLLRDHPLMTHNGMRAGLQRGYGGVEITTLPTQKAKLEYFEM